MDSTIASSKSPSYVLFFMLAGSDNFPPLFFIISLASPALFKTLLAIKPPVSACNNFNEGETLLSWSPITSKAYRYFPAAWICSSVKSAYLKKGVPFGLYLFIAAIPSSLTITSSQPTSSTLLGIDLRNAALFLTSSLASWS